MGHLNLKELKELIDLVSEKGFAEFELERQGFRIRIARFQEPQPVQSQPEVAPAPGRSVRNAPVERSLPELDEEDTTVQPAAAASAATSEDLPPREVLHTITSPIVGTFYRSSSPAADPFVKVGDRVEPDSVVCIIEAMKLMNEIQAEVSGEIVTIYIENAQPVEYGQPLFAVKS